MEVNNKPIDDCKSKLIFLFNGANNMDAKAIPIKYKIEIFQLINDLRVHTSPEEFLKFFAGYRNIGVKSPVKQAEEIIKNHRGYNNGRN